ncbi:MAG: hypothetical protein RLZZ546_1904 [Bacteroidota bacterium]|jgi:2-polyprenyl-3-methyl-5-hydroxy-6-metoxy-1,4-benzoquinol methylase
MFDFHSDKKRYFDIQHWVTKEYIIPYLDLKKSSHILEIGCAEAGVLKAFLEAGHTCTGIELSSARAEIASTFLEKEIKSGKAQIINKNIYDIENEDSFKFDVVVLKDVIEHIPDHEKFLIKLKDLLNEDGLVFFAYPPWWMPFGGHQQICKSNILSKTPWFHLLPSAIYKKVLELFQEPKNVIDELMDIKSTCLISDQLHFLLKKQNYQIIKETYWLTNPIYVKKFGFNPLKSHLNIPYLRNIYCTAHYVLFRLGKGN